MVGALPGYRPGTARPAAEKEAAMPQQTRGKGVEGRSGMSKAELEKAVGR